jgi:hypothetical protein
VGGGRWAVASQQDRRTIFILLDAARVMVILLLLDHLDVIATLVLLLDPCYRSGSCGASV